MALALVTCILVLELETISVVCMYSERQYVVKMHQLATPRIARNPFNNSDQQWLRNGVGVEVSLYSE